MRDVTLTLNGTFYPTFASNTARYSEEDKKSIEDLVRRLMAIETSAARPGMLLGKIQSGKTKTFIGALALGFDNGWDVAIVLTKGTKALAKQTHERVLREFAAHIAADRLQAFDIMTVPGGLTGYELNQKLIFVAKKQQDNLDRLIDLVLNKYPAVATRRALIVDDEADYASVGFRKTKEEGIIANTTTHQLERLRQILPNSAFLQVTATPYALYLQPPGFTVQGNEFRPIRPAFTSLVPVKPDYVGGEYYFAKSLEENSVASYIYCPVPLRELAALKKPDGRRFKCPSEVLTTDAIATLRGAICTFIVGGIVRRLQDAGAAATPKKYSFLVHTEAGKEAHEWQQQVVTAIHDELVDAVASDVELVQGLFATAYADLKPSIEAQGQPVPAESAVLEECLTALREGWLMITKVNSEQEVERLLDSEGQLKLRTPLNVFIGGQILDRGITLVNMIGFFYGRRPQKYQQDTVLQHSRMFGFRPKEDLCVTRFYTEPQIYEAMRRMHESDTALRETIETDPDRAVVFVQKDDRGAVVPCSPNKILMSSTTTLKPYKRLLPIGFDTDYAVRIKKVVEDIDQLLDDLNPNADFDEPFEITLTAGLDILKRIEPTILMKEDEGYEFDWEAARAALSYLANLSKDPARRDRVWCLVRKSRNLSQEVAKGSHAKYADAPDTTRTEGDVAKAVGIENPVLILIRQNGKKEQGWRDTPFWWPVIHAQKNVRTTIFANETTD